MLRSVKVTEGHVKDGSQRQACCCPVAVAIMDQHPDCYDIDVARDFVRVLINGTVHQADLGADISERIKKFDETGEMEPFEFSIDLNEVSD